MRKLWIGVNVFVLLLSAWVVYAQVGAKVAIGIIEAVNFVDFNEVSPPPNPAAGDQRWFASNVTHRIACITSTGADCTTTPAGAIGLITLGVCPTGFSEVPGLDGKTLIGTIAAHMNVGSTGGDDSLTSTFAGDVMPPHPHQLPFMVDDSNLVVGVAKSGVYGVGPDMNSYVQQLNNDGVTTSGIGAALTESVSAGTPTGVNSTEDNRSAFVRVIFCAKN